MLKLQVHHIFSTCIKCLHNAELLEKYIKITVQKMFGFDCLYFHLH